MHAATLDTYVYSVKAPLSWFVPQTCLVPKASKQLAANVRRLMDESDDLRTQSALGKKPGLTQRTVGRVLNEENSPTLDVVEALAEAFKTTPAALLSERPSLEADVAAVAAQYASLSDQERQRFRLLLLAARNGVTDKEVEEGFKRANVVRDAERRSGQPRGAEARETMFHDGDLVRKEDRRHQG